MSGHIIKTVLKINTNKCFAEKRSRLGKRDDNRIHDQEHFSRTGNMKKDLNKMRARTRLENKIGKCCSY